MPHLHSALYLPIHTHIIFDNKEVLLFLLQIPVLPLSYVPYDHMNDPLTHAQNQ